MFLVLQEVIDPITRDPLLSVGQRINGTELMRLSAEHGFDETQCLLEHEVIQRVPDMTQNQMQTLHNMAMDQIQMYASGLITLPELTRSISEIGQAVNVRNIVGLIDPSSGLRFE
jgi:hypothetical protein